MFSLGSEVRGCVRGDSLDICAVAVLRNVIWRYIGPSLNSNESNILVVGTVIGENDLIAISTHSLFVVGESKLPNLPSCWHYLRHIYTGWLP